ncbi:hypothetical protein VSX64_18065 [Aurantimonas sp. C2-6-R+9]|uniref:hypothetical protein n=1 Tax=unclassified Aurantimonas TaxID=2638230 RepID=UPI002E183275|nr:MULTISPECIES: hypothetical protein [unclassified Aurantimonas]MEC5291939.1 hypothetical protein [Aurantimonas sp. C2-3-R2]MEC5382748.1 hypothetical protein [Aurantimonas sp. C2-6-R+9]MEC5413025.1 hypothetical protein [Aurantimonas sp. C2-4-R8]
MQGFADFIQRAVGILPSFISLVVAFCLIAGITLIVRGVMIAGSYGDVETRYAGTGVKTSIYVHLIVGALLISLPTSISSFLQTFFAQPTAPAASEIFAYAPDMLEPVSHDQAREIVIALLRCVQFFGLLGFVRGLFLLNQAPVRPGNGLVGKGATHLVGGVLAMNIVMFVGMIEDLVVG